MSLEIPAALKQLDIARFALRASQLVNVKPVIAYWCDYYIIQKILQSGIPKQNPESMKYATHIMDKLETVKANNLNLTSITDDSEAFKYVESFANDVFSRAEHAMQSQCASRATVDTLLAAVVFYDLLSIWITNSLPEHIAIKVKYAKYHALRIEKAIRAGKDPNLSNPVCVNASVNPDNPTQSCPSISTVTNPPPTTSETVLSPPPGEEFIEWNETTSDTFVTAPSTASDVDDIEPSNSVELSSPTKPTQLDQPFSTPVTHHSGIVNVNEPFHLTVESPTKSLASPALPQTVQTNLPSSPSNLQSAPPDKSSSNAKQCPNNPPIGDDAICLAQKHARWAISALTFDDIPTAVKELKAALCLLNASPDAESFSSIST